MHDVLRIAIAAIRSVDRLISYVFFELLELHNSVSAYKFMYIFLNFKIEFQRNMVVEQ